VEFPGKQQENKNSQEVSSHLLKASQQETKINYFFCFVLVAQEEAARLSKPLRRATS
jgi:hypothetical protein